MIQNRKEKLEVDLAVAFSVLSDDVGPPKMLVFVVGKNPNPVKDLWFVSPGTKKE